MEYMFLSLITDKLRVLIIGGGKAGLLKAKSFLNRGCCVTVISREFNEGFQKFEDSSCLTLKNESYSSIIIKDFHLIVIAVKEQELVKSIIEDCHRETKIFLNCKSFKEGMFVMPTQRDTEHACFALHTKGGSPRAAKYVGDVMEKKLWELDSFIGFTAVLREKLKASSIKDEVMTYISSEEFRYFYEKGVHEIVLEIFYGEELNKIYHKSL